MRHYLTAPGVRSQPTGSFVKGVILEAQRLACRSDHGHTTGRSKSEIQDAAFSAHRLQSVGAVHGFIICRGWFVCMAVAAALADALVLFLAQSVSGIYSRKSRVKRDNSLAVRADYIAHRLVSYKVLV